MALEVYDHNTNRKKMVSCPACGKRFDKYEMPCDHIYMNHGPEDFGLPPKGERR